MKGKDGTRNRIKQREMEREEGEKDWKLRQ